MKLSDYERPPRDNGRGLQAPLVSNWNGGKPGLEFWMSELGALGVKWLQVLDDGGDSLPLCEQLLARGIFPIARILRRDPAPNDGREPNPGHINTREENAIRKLISAGVLYFETNSEPNLATAWKDQVKPDDQYAAELVALNWLFDARFILEAGGYPALPAISNGANFDLMGALAQIGHLEILREGCWLAVHNSGRNRPLDFPDDIVNQNGAPLGESDYEHGELTAWAWRNVKTRRTDTLNQINARRAREKRAGQTLAQDHACFREFEHYNARATELLGQPLPILSTAGGYMIDNRDDARYARVTPQKHAELTVALFDFMSARAPDYYFCAIGGRLSDASDDPNAWYGRYWSQQLAVISDRLPVVGAVKAMPDRARQIEQPGTTAPPPSTGYHSPPKPETMPSENVYIVRDGETLTEIARKFGVTDYSLAKFNRLADPLVSLTGKTLIIPAPLEKDSARAETVEHITRVATPPPPRLRKSNIEWDPRLDALHASLEPAPFKEGETYWRLVRAEYLDSEETKSRHQVFFVLREESGVLASKQTVVLATTDESETMETDEQGSAALTMWTGYFPERGESGAYRGSVEGASDVVAGLGLPAQNLVSFRLTFQRVRRQ